MYSEKVVFKSRDGKEGVEIKLQRFLGERAACRHHLLHGLVQLLIDRADFEQFGVNVADKLPALIFQRV